MARVNAAIALLVLPWAVPAHADPVGHWAGYVAEASARFGIPASWITRVMRAESAGRTTLDGRPIVSRAGAMGLMQLMPGTWRDMRAALRLGASPYDPHDNILAGAYYLRLMYDRFGYPGLFGAYNAGPARYEAWLAGKNKLPGETRAYLANVAGDGPDGAKVAQRVNPIFFRFRHSARSADIGNAGFGMFVALESADGAQAGRSGQAAVSAEQAR